jgi:hypothetical protein
MCIKKYCTKNPTISKITISPLEKHVPHRNIVHHHPPPLAALEKEMNNHHTEMSESTVAYKDAVRADEPGRRKRETDTLWQIGQGSSPWSPDSNVANFIRRSRRRGTSSPAITHVLNCKTASTTTTVNTIVARKSADHRAPNTNLCRFEMTRPPVT